MWCVLHVKKGNEARTEAFLSGLFSEKPQVRCFHLTRSRRKKYGGMWRTVQENLLPGYVFIDTDEPEEVHEELKRTGGFKLLFSEGEGVSSLKKYESDFMSKVADRQGNIPVSKIKIVADGVEVLEGPLLQVEDLIKKVNLHQRTVEIEADFMCRNQRLYLGIELER